MYGFRLLVIGLTCVALQCCRQETRSAEEKAAAPERKWAEKIERPGLANLHKVSDSLYRGAQPTAEGFRELRKLGVKTVINLRSRHSDKDLLGDTGLGYVAIETKAYDVGDEAVVKFLEVVSDKSRAPFFVHCEYGSDRTGTMCAIYRIVVCGWSKDEAIEEMTEGGFGFHPLWKNLISYIRKADIGKLRKQAGLDRVESED